MRSDNNFFDVEKFIAYVKNQGITKENYTNMVISATCYRDNELNDFYHVGEKLAEIRDELIKYLIDRHQETNGTQESLIQDLKNHALYQQWNSNRFFSTILWCYLEGGVLDRIMTITRHRPHPEPYLKSDRSLFFRTNDEPYTEPDFHSISRDTPKTSIQPLTMLIISGVVAVFFILGMKLYKRRIHIINKVRIEGDGLYYDIRGNIIENA
ncbi:hypothetical protein RF11_05103 [Thelohanellus kitauei]|uniref:Uncharacterized protein n=1 Tax=Thelohanellus kitauei TaxID=669202 RepID=A0A0C2MQF3_THEKT|nr:hypothetical protein RF11_05103 [Thelohanellus kitauei]